MTCEILSGYSLGGTRGAGRRVGPPSPSGACPQARRDRTLMRGTRTRSFSDRMRDCPTRGRSPQCAEPFPRRESGPEPGMPFPEERVNRLGRSSFDRPRGMLLGLAWDGHACGRARRRHDDRPSLGRSPNGTLGKEKLAIQGYTTRGYSRKTGARTPGATRASRPIRGRRTGSLPPPTATSSWPSPHATSRRTAAALVRDVEGDRFR